MPKNWKDQYFEILEIYHLSTYVANKQYVLYFKLKLYFKVCAVATG